MRSPTRGLGVALTAALALLSAAPSLAQPHADFDALMGPQSQLGEARTVTPVGPWHDPAPLHGGAVEVPLATLDALWAAARAAAEAQSADRQGPAVVLGAADYRGEAIDGVLHLDVTLALTLGREGAWKAVPLVGASAVLVAARVDGEPVGVSARHGYHVWLTQRTGEVRVELEILVAPRGPRGSIEYDLAIARTPVTAFTCTFPVAGLEPRVDDAVVSDVTSDAASTTLTATLRPGTRLHLVGFRDLGDARDVTARVYAESFNLLSVDDRALELFTEVRYTILYAGTRRFELLVPPGLTVISADGRGAFRYELEPRADGTLVRGETALPMRDSYAVSLRLRRETTRGGERFAVPLPRSLGVERDAGWLAVEVPGKMQLEEASRDPGVTPIDARQLPDDLVRSAVSPILRAYRYTAAGAGLELVVTRLPEVEPASESVDDATALTVLSPEGGAVTELRVRLRNRLRPALALALPADAEVRSVLLDGAPAKPSRDQAGRLLLPLKRSEGDASSLTPISLQIVYEERAPALGLFGAREFTLPAFELPVANLHWRLLLPSANRYGDPSGDVGSERWGEGRWSDPVARPDDVGDGVAADATPTQLDLGGDGAATAETGAMPVRITLPTAGRSLELHRYWLGADAPVVTTITWVRSWIPPTLITLAALFLLAGAFLLGGRPSSRRARLAVAGGAALVTVGLFGLVALDTSWTRALVGLAVVVALARRGTLQRAWRATRRWLGGLPAAYRAREVELERRVVWARAGRVVVLAGLVVVVYLLLGEAPRVLAVLLDA